MINWDSVAFGVLLTLFVAGYIAALCFLAVYGIVVFTLFLTLASFVVGYHTGYKDGDL